MTNGNVFGVNYSLSTRGCCSLNIIEFREHRASSKESLGCQPIYNRLSPKISKLHCTLTGTSFEDATDKATGPVRTCEFSYTLFNMKIDNGTQIYLALLQNHQERQRSSVNNH